MQFVGDNLRFLEDAFRELGELEKAEVLALNYALKDEIVHV